ncbi:hypothetical protein DPEC_G00178160 [Dallia pectoralis]|uniref:Uncharacterized protein n=1 Tax=Dallia pectoralis TaxID=75939 RepID=A0ACC2GFI0_DALPE|nr:hypothetical protein DPEC_G00178160 [Dallia pectoralis]
MERLNYLTRLLAETKPPASCRPTSRTSREQAVRIMCSAAASTLARSGHSAPVAGSNGLDLPPVPHYRGFDCRGGLSCTMEHEEDRQCPACQMSATAEHWSCVSCRCRSRWIVGVISQGQEGQVGGSFR